MSLRIKINLILFLFCLLVSPVVMAAGKWSGNVTLEYRNFKNEPIDNRQHDNNWAFSAQPEFYKQWDQERQSFTFVPFFRVDQQDSDRSHVDIRELTWVRINKTHEWRLGFRKVFWGVTETQHLVDIINQTDLVESIDGEEKLGQPMVNLSLPRDWGTLDFFVLLGFRERTFPGKAGRLRTQPRIDTSQAVYESSKKKQHIDFAIRWAHSIGDWDLGLSQFDGTSRGPRFVPGLSKTGALVLVPNYDQISQTGIDVQLTKGSWLWKLEAIRRKGNGRRYYAYVGGFEYTFHGIFKSKKDLGLLIEYHRDNRNDAAVTPFQDDVFLGFRVSFNDAQSTEILFGSIQDRDSDASSFFLEASRRIGNHWKASVEIRTFEDIPANDILFFFRDEDYLQLELAYFF